MHACAPTIASVLKFTKENFHAKIKFLSELSVTAMAKKVRLGLKVVVPRLMRGPFKIHPREVNLPLKGRLPLHYESLVDPGMDTLRDKYSYGICQAEA